MNPKSKIENRKFGPGWKAPLCTIACALSGTVGIGLVAPAPCPAGCRVATRAVVCDVVTVPVAVSVGVPVAVVAPYYYSYQQYVPAQPVDVDAIAARGVEKLRESQPTPKPPAAATSLPTAESPPAPRTSLVSQRCVQCHGGVWPQGRPFRWRILPA